MIRAFVLTILSSVISLMIAAQLNTKVYLNSGETFSGELTAIGTNYITLQTESNTVRIQRREIRFQLSEPTVDDKAVKKNRLELKPLNNKWTVEMQTGLTVISPFALRADLHIWRAIDDRWSVSIGPTLQFYRFTSMNITARGRYAGRPNKLIRPFVEGGASVSFYETVGGMNFRQSIGVANVPEGYVSSFTPLKQIEFGPGLILDTGMGVAFTSKVLFNASWFAWSQELQFGDIDAQYQIFTLSFLGGFIF